MTTTRTHSKWEGIFFNFLFLQTLLFCHAFIVVVIIIIITFPFFSKISRIKYFAKIKYEIVGDDDFSISLSLAFLLTSIYFRSDRVIQAMKTDQFEWLLVVIIVGKQKWWSTRNKKRRCGNFCCCCCVCENETTKIEKEWEE